MRQFTATIEAVQTKMQRQVEGLLTALPLPPGVGPPIELSANATAGALAPPGFLPSSLAAVSPQGAMPALPGMF